MITFKDILSETDFDHKAMMCSKIITYIAQEPSFTCDINSLVDNQNSSIVSDKRNAPASKNSSDSKHVDNDKASRPFKWRFQSRRYQKVTVITNSSGLR